jgi:hypothetical protein
VAALVVGVGVVVVAVQTLTPVCMAHVDVYVYGQVYVYEQVYAVLFVLLLVIGPKICFGG